MCSSIVSNKSNPSNVTTYLTPCSSFSLDELGESTSVDFHSIATDSDDLNATITNQTLNSLYETCVEATNRLVDVTRSFPRSVRQHLHPLRRSFLNKFTKLQRLSVVQQSQINICGKPTTEVESCTCTDGLFDGNCLKTFMEMSVQPAEYRNNSQIMTSTPVITKDVYDHSIFNVARIKKVELHDLSPMMPEFHGKSDFCPDQFDYYFLF